MCDADPLLMLPQQAPVVLEPLPAVLEPLLAVLEPMLALLEPLLAAAELGPVGVPALSPLAAAEVLVVEQFQPRTTQMIDCRRVLQPQC